MEKLNKLFALAQRADAYGNLIDCVNPHDVIDIAESFLAMKKRAEAAEAEVKRLNATAQPVSDGCKWSFDDDGYWWSACGSSWVFNDGGPIENECNFCQKCGGKVLLESEPGVQDD